MELRGVVSGRLSLDGKALYFRNARASQVDLSGEGSWHFVSSFSTFDQCDFSRLRPDAGSLGASQRPSVYRDCSFEEADLRGVSPGLARFERCVFDRTRIHGWFAFDAEFVDCRFTEAEIVGCKFAGTRDRAGFSLLRRRSKVLEFRGNDFSQAYIDDTAFVRGVDLDAQCLPTSDEYIRLDRIGERIQRLTQQVEGWEQTTRDEALALAEVYGFHSGDQPELFARRYELEADPAVVDRFWAALSEPLRA